MFRLFTFVFFICSFSYSNKLILKSEPIQYIEMPTNLDNRKVELGRKLFMDKRLSRDNSISCNSCHNLSFSGTDNLEKSFGVERKLGVINTPTVFNSSLNFVQFWDGRAKDLFDQIDGPIHNPIEMATDWPTIVKKLNEVLYYKTSFNLIYKDVISSNNIKNALVEFEKSLITPSRFDRYLKGDTSAITKDELEGYTLFKDYGCSSCHQGKNIGGNFYEKLGVFKKYPMDNDENYYGRYNITKNQEEKFEFKVPSLRNVYYTYPYLHNGKIKTLNEVIKVMAEYQIGRIISHSDTLKIEAFLKSLSYEKLEKKHE